MPLNPTEPFVSCIACLNVPTHTCHVEGETSVGSIEGTPIDEVSSETGGENGAGGINANTNPSRRSLRHRTGFGKEARRTG